MSQSQYVGRGELLSKKILLKLLPCIGIQGQVNIKDVVLPEDYIILDQEIKNHNFDWVVRRTNTPDIVVEVNYGHKEKAARKWRLIFVPMIKRAGLLYMTIDDYDCRAKGLFYLDSKKEHKLSWDDHRDIIDSLEKAEISPI